MQISRHLYEINTTPDIINVVNMSNIKVPGKFLFRIDTERIEAGGELSNTHLVHFVIGSLTVTPRYGSMLGGQRIHIGGPCILIDDYITIRYGENTETYDCVRENDFKVTCVTPMFYRTGDMKIELTIKHERGTSSKYVGVYSTSKAANEIKIVKHKDISSWHAKTKKKNNNKIK
ncbi:hypothetical protein KUTeg_022716 [Tegillarca granosa]|uniref:Uncharacterized protein n=1 Tax=Tegillarca granosa TaxID=220873 RepID=A0ABQ9DZJ5_TEGGR|nr:hypothetical protein KUTeg_022716 [Tegillarca granosa]